MPSRVLALLIVLLSCVLSLGAQEDSGVADFKRYFKEYAREYTKAGKDEKDRHRAVVTLREAVLSLKGTEAVEAVEALLPALKIAEAELDEAVVNVLAGFKTEPPVSALFAALGKEKNEHAVTVLLRAVERGKYQGNFESLSGLCDSPSWEVRRRAALALVQIPDPAAHQRVAEMYKDREAAVRLTVLDALAEIESPAVVEPALAALADSLWQARVAGIQALRRVRRGEALAPLVQLLAKEEGRLSVDIAATLEELTGLFYGQDLARWQDLLVRSRGNFPVPTKEEVALLRQRHLSGKGPRTGAGGQSEALETAAGTPDTKYHGIETPSRKILFVIDCSGSMENLVVEKDRFQDGNYPSFARIDIVKTELIRTIERLDEHVEFNVEAFATDVRTWKKELQSANGATKQAAIGWVRKLEAIGGSSNDSLAQAGLAGSANLEAGKTNTFEALMTALGVTDKNALDQGYAIKVDTVFFLSDGRPSFGDFVDPQDILREVKKANELRKVVLHTIAIGEFQKDFMRTLAVQHGGIFVDLGR